MVHALERVQDVAADGREAAGRETLSARREALDLFLEARAEPLEYEVADARVLAVRDARAEVAREAVQDVGVPEARASLDRACLAPRNIHVAAAAPPRPVL